jgi:hypothetical protein
MKTTVAVCLALAIACGSTAPRSDQGSEPHTGGSPHEAGVPDANVAAQRGANPADAAPAPADAAPRNVSGQPGGGRADASAHDAAMIDAGRVPARDSAVAVDADVTAPCNNAACDAGVVTMLPGTPRAVSDEHSGLQWMHPAAMATVPVATAYCEDLRLDGHDDWRLPTITELRTMIRGCADDEPDGVCGVTPTCIAVDSCYGCTACNMLEGPGPDGCYWDAAFDGDPCSSYWSSTPVSDRGMEMLPTGASSSTRAG